MQESDSLLTSGLLDGLPVQQRLALAYAPASARTPTLALLALDTRLASILRGSSEPMLAQLRLAWWREQLVTEATRWPEGEPLLAALRSWQGRRADLVELVNGWEQLTGQAPLPPAALEGFAQARGNAFGALAELLGCPEDITAARRFGQNWALADMAAHLSHKEERGAAHALMEQRDWRRARLSRRMRPLAVLHGLAARRVRQGRVLAAHSPGDLLVALRLGLIGR